MTERVHVDRDGTIHVPGLPPARILSFTPPLLVLEREGRIRKVFLAPGDRGGWFGLDGQSFPIPSTSGPAAAGVGSAEPLAGDLTAPMPGRVLEVLVAVGDGVVAGTRLLILEAMKMETPIRAPAAGTVRVIHVAMGDAVDPGQVLIEIDGAESS